jgi:hypothetical protein
MSRAERSVLSKSCHAADEPAQSSKTPIRSLKLLPTIFRRVYALNFATRKLFLQRLPCCCFVLEWAIAQNFISSAMSSSKTNPLKVTGGDAAAYECSISGRLLIIARAVVNKQHVATAKHYATNVYTAIILRWE